MLLGNDYRYEALLQRHRYSPRPSAADWTASVSSMQDQARQGKVMGIICLQHVPLRALRLAMTASPAGLRLAPGRVQAKHLADHVAIICGGFTWSCRISPSPMPSPSHCHGHLLLLRS